MVDDGPDSMLCSLCLRVFCVYVPLVIGQSKNQSINQRTGSVCGQRDDGAVSVRASAQRTSALRTFLRVRMCVCVIWIFIIPALVCTIVIVCVLVGPNEIISYLVATIETGSPIKQL